MKEKENKDSNSVTMEKQYANVESMTDSEFLSWLYLERDREESIHKLPGWNTWIIIAALISIINFIYFFLTESKDIINVYQSIVFSSWLVTLLIDIYPFFTIVEKKRAIDHNRIRELKDQAPILYARYITSVTALYSFIMFVMEPSFLDFLHYWPWMALAVLYLSALICIRINKNKIVQASKNLNLFPSSIISFIFNLVSLGITFMASMSSKREVPRIDSQEFILGVAFASIIVLIYLLILYIYGGWNNIEELIDNVVYNKFSRKEVFQKLKVIRLGYLPVEYLKNYVEKLEVIHKGCIDSICTIEQAIDEISKQKTYSFELIQRTQKKIECLNKLCCMHNDYSKLLRKKLKEISINKNTSKDTETQQFVESIDDRILDNGTLIELCNKLTTALKIYVERYQCKKYNMLCYKEDCKQRNKSGLPKYKMIRKLVSFCHNKHC